MTHDLTDKGMREILAEEYRRRGWRHFADEVLEGNGGVDEVPLAAMTRIRDAAYEDCIAACEKQKNQWGHPLIARHRFTKAIRSLSKPLEKENG